MAASDYADDLRIGGRDLHEVVVGASRSEGRWRANIASREIVGQFEWRDPRLGERVGTLTARFVRLELPRSREGEVESALSAAPSSLPGLDVSVDELLGGMHELLGHEAHEGRAGQTEEGCGGHTCGCGEVDGPG